jgi:integrase
MPLGKKFALPRLEQDRRNELLKRLVAREIALLRVRKGPLSARLGTAAQQAQTSGNVSGKPPSARFARRRCRRALGRAAGIEEATMHTTIPTLVGFANAPWNKGRLIGQKRPLKPKEVWAIRVRLQIEGRKRGLALFNLAIDSKLRACDLVALQLEDVCVGGRVRDRATVIQKKTGRPVQFEITEQTRSSIRDWLSEATRRSGQYLFPGRYRAHPHLSTRQYARIVHGWVESAGLDSSAYGTHSMRRTKAAQIYRKTGNLRAAQQLLGHTKLESTVRYLGIEVDDALSIVEQVEL